MSLVPRSLSLVAASLLVFAAASPAQNTNPNTVNWDPSVVVDFTPGSSSDVKAEFKTNAPHSHSIGGHTSHGIPAIDSLLNFSGQYHADGYDSAGNAQSKWLYNIVGQMPQHGGTTVINAPIVPVKVTFLNGTGTPVLTLDPNAPLNGVSGPSMVTNALNSPVFQNAMYSSSSTPTQFTDAVQRAEFYKSAKDDWHTILKPSVKTTRTIAVDPAHYRVYTYGKNGPVAFLAIDYRYFVNAFFPSTPTDTTTPIGAAENAHEITTRDFSTFLFPSVYLYSGGSCCTLGFHSYDYEPGDEGSKIPEKRYVVNYSAWVTPGPAFGTAFADVTAMSHEIAEAYNDPFVASDGAHNIAPWWAGPNGYTCQNNLETGDVIEGLSNATYPMTMNGYTYHPQNETLLQWFEQQPLSDAIGAAYSYPDTTVLGSPITGLKPGCVQ